MFCLIKLSIERGSLNCKWQLNSPIRIPYRVTISNCHKSWQREILYRPDIWLVISGLSIHGISSLNMSSAQGLQSGKTYCAGFCPSPVALLAGSGYNASCNGLQWLETAADCNKVREDVAWLIYLYLGKHDIFSAFHGKENKFSPACWEAL